ncbi:Ig-like domain-containing protein [Pyxidicoccus trucidator]|uniref:Ig-like domain-containing protein n=1 Tax=Pyxidicoccus trucidator TaxID=2709662 RepID=UPI0013DC7FAD|nr:Ig-like domain-containing protein [Pyxidicoccus trucidator]
MSMHSTRGASRASRLWLAALSSVLLVAPLGCDDNDDNKEVDRTAPTVVSQVPATGSDAEWDGVISFTVSEPLAASSVVDASVKLLEDGTEIQKELLLSDDGKTVTVLLSQALDLPSVLAVELTPALTDVAGNPVTLPEKRWVWEARTWRLLKTPVMPEHGASGALPSLVLDVEKRPLLSFVEVDDVPAGQPTESGWVFTRWSGGNWERISQYHPDSGGLLAVDGAGRLYTVGHRPRVNDTDFPESTVRRWDGQGWPEVSPPLGRSWKSAITDGTRLAVTSTGIPLLAWEVNSWGHGAHVIVYTLEAGAWLPLPGLAAPPYYRPRNLSLVLDAEDRPWSAHYEQGPVVKSYVSRWDGAAFVKVGGSLEDDAGSASRALAADLKVDAAGTPYVAWRSAERLYLQRWDGTRWETLATREAPGTLVHEDRLDLVSLVLASGGHAYVAWIHRPASGPAELRVDRWNGTTLESSLEGLAVHDTNAVAMTLDAHGRPMVAVVTPPAPCSHVPGIQVRVNH